MVYENVMHYARLKGIPIYKLEKEAGIAQNSIAKWKNHSPSVASVIAVAKVLGVSMNLITSGKE